MGTGFVGSIKLLISIIGSVIIGLLGGWDKALETLIVFMIIDYILGFSKGLKFNKVSSAVSFWGIFNKIIMLSLVVIVNSIGELMNISYSRYIAILWLLLNELISIIENVDILIPGLIPTWLSKKLVQSKVNFSINLSKIVDKILDDKSNVKDIDIIKNRDNNTLN